uniref:ATP synthase F0 subunit 8 n=2 Tax=Floraphis TaxID=509178 RepID=A0A1Z1MWM2_9HEMI|nr:ATP synthase F0 subunit 8 [Floraphis choui]YP_009400311.1 ATP synthase F0 subunit 8 [Floraphis meitanensis]ARW70243.1 ATP synthase F0 subunit 8 [Floraphis choui]ARW70373.1 ATP synthase F0 subunit 8 [Floraphis meitanensis]
MAPLNWLILFMFFTLMFMMILTMIYFLFTKFIKINLTKKQYTKNYNKFI